MNDDAAHREEHIGEYLQNADWEETTDVSPCVLCNCVFAPPSMREL
jgi:hypothetical protein